MYIVYEWNDRSMQTIIDVCIFLITTEIYGNDKTSICHMIQFFQVPDGTIWATGFCTYIVSSSIMESIRIKIDRLSGMVYYYIAILVWIRINQMKITPNVASEERNFLRR